MHILITNDDGYLAPGIKILAEELSQVAAISVVAPDRNKSGASNSLTLTRPLRVDKTANGFYSVDGTPTDCVHLALSGLLDDSPDMVVSGINAGPNLGDDVLYSGTVAGAMEGRYLGLPAIAVPMIFPPVRLGNEYFGDGAMRQATPLSPAVHLGADRILVIGIRDETGGSPADTEPERPSFAQIAGYMLDTLFMDGLYSDLERITRINQLIDAAGAADGSEAASKMRAIDTMLIVPSEDLRVIAHRHRRELPFAIRALLRGIGGNNPGENRLLSFLLFEKAYTRELINLGYKDAMRVKDQLLNFVTGADVPRLFAPSWIKKDLSAFTPDS